MKIIDIALKGLLRSFRSTFAVAMMFLLPLLIPGMMYMAFGGAGDDGGFDLPVTRVQLANLDQPSSQDGGFAAGQVLAGLLHSAQLADTLQVTDAASEAAARAAVKAQEADVAVIIPPGFTAAVLSSGESATITLLQDPTLTLGPAIVKGLLDQFVDGFAGARIAVSVATGQLVEHNVQVDETLAQDIAARYADWARASGQSQSAGTHPALDIQPPPGKAESGTGMGSLISSMVAGMLIFFAFFTAASAAEAIIREDEEGTLARLFTTPTPRTVILGGHFVVVLSLLVVQVLVLMLASALIFGISWGNPLAVSLVALGLIVSAAGFGLFLMSFVKTTRQAGPMMGGVLTLFGMAGGLFTAGLQNLPPVYDTITLLTPHGWALRGFRLALAGGGVGDVLLPVGVMLGLGMLLFAGGAFLFRKRFA